MEMDRMKIDIIGIAVTRWPDNGEFWSGDYKVIHTGTIEGRSVVGGVATVMNKEAGKKPKGYLQFDGRIILVKLNTKPKDTIIIQVYMPTTNEGDEEVEKFYDMLIELIDGIKGEENVIIMVDWNATVGEGREGMIVGPFVLGKRNERGDRLVEFCS
ncbi:craniofacial development protein 2-like [Ischnura elegans]|uniref:craniofacial development protein 2-like n=1 Tax=Ischnura elegans TaxID=197161 RepID=UPI001ED8A050|nr:craniofacial development protein 2-like [Ischnura elegans]